MNARRSPRPMADGCSRRCGRSPPPRRPSPPATWASGSLQGPDDEFKALGDTLDGLLERLQASFDAAATIEFQTGVQDGRALLTVANTGPRVPPDQLDRLCSNPGATRWVGAALPVAVDHRGFS